MPLQPARFWPWMAAMKRFGFLPVLTLIAFTFTTSYVDAQQTSSNVVAVVNADPITSDTLADASVTRYGIDVLDNMINRHLILQACQKSGVEVTSEEVREEIARLSSKFGLSMEAYLKLLSDERDISPDQYSREVVWPMLALRRLVQNEVEPTKQEFNQAFISQFGEAVKCRMIMVPNKETAESLRAAAEKNPGQFGNLAKKYSKDEASASVGGLIPPIRKFTSDSRLENAAFALQDNQVSDVLQLGDQWIVLQAVRRIPASPPPAKAVPAITEQIKDRIRDQKMRGAATKLFTKLQADAKVVKVLGDEKLQQQYPGVAAVVNGQQVTIASVAAECVKRHGSDVLEGEINRKLLKQALRQKGLQVTRADIQAEIARAAKSYGFANGDGTADIAAWMDSVTKDGNTTQFLYESDSVWPSVALKKLVESTVKVTNEDLQRGYESSFGPKVEVLAIVLADQRTAQKVWEMARDNPNEQFFAKLAEQYSVEPVSASNQGKVPPIRKYGGQPAIEREAFALKPGELSGIVATGDKYIVLRCQGHTTPVVEEIADVKDELIRDITEKKMGIAMASEFDRLKESAEIDNYLDASKKAARVATRSPSTAAQRK